MVRRAFERAGSPAFMDEHKHHHAPHPYAGLRKGYRVVFLLAFSAGLLAEMLLFLQAQMREIASLLKEDFRIVVVKDDRTKVKPEDIGAALSAIKGTDQAVFVSCQDRLARLKAEEPDLVASVLPPGSNPMPDTWEVIVREDALGNLNSWIDAAWRVKGVGDIKYKPLEAYAIMHAVFYDHLIGLGLALSFLAFMLMAAMTLTYWHESASLTVVMPGEKAWILAGAAGAALSSLAAYVVVYPVKNLSPVWVWPNPLWQAVAVGAGALMGWSLGRWKNDHNR